MLFASSTAALLPSLAAAPTGFTGVCATIGNFDGVHAGHRALIQRVRACAAQHSWHSLVVTFWPHPLAVLRQQGPGLIVSRPQKQHLLEQEQLDAVLEIPFTKELAALTPEAFIRKFLLPLQLRHLVVGYDFSLGKNRAGTPEVLADIGQRLGFTVEQLPAVTKDGEIVSSTRIRRCLQYGITSDLPGMRAQYHHIDGKIHAITQTCDAFSIAHVATPQVMLPKPGMYAAWAQCGAQLHEAVTYIGDNASADAPIRTIFLNTPPAHAENLALYLVACLDTGRDAAHAAATHDAAYVMTLASKVLADKQHVDARGLCG